MLNNSLMNSFNLPQRYPADEASSNLASLSATIEPWEAPRLCERWEGIPRLTSSDGVQISSFSSNSQRNKNVGILIQRIGHLDVRKCSV